MHDVELPSVLLEHLLLAVQERDGKREGPEWRFRCPYPAMHEHGDAHPSARWNPTKGVWVCDVCKNGGGAFDLATLLDVDYQPDYPRLILKNGKHEPGPPALTLAAFAAQRKLPLDMLVNVFKVTEVVDRDRPALSYPTRKGQRLKYLDGGKPKYRWVKSGSETLYNSHNALELLQAGADTLYLVNGEPSVWACQAEGVPAICLCTGEKAPSLEAVRALRQLLGKAEHLVKIVVCYDQDTPGQKAQAEAVTFLSSSIIATFFWGEDKRLPEGGDVDDLHRIVGSDLAAVLAASVQQPVPEEPDDAQAQRERHAWQAVIVSTPLWDGNPPYWIQRWVEHVRPFGQAFDDDFLTIMALPFWASFWPKVRMENLNLGIWALGFGKQNVGKNLVSDELRAVAHDVAQRTMEQVPALYTSGTVQGIWETLGGLDKKMLVYQREFGGYLQELKREHMTGARQALCDLYDGSAVGYRRSMGKIVEIINPYVVVCATINIEDWVRYAELADLTNGYLSRFIMWAGDIYERSPLYFPGDDARRHELITLLVAHVHAYQDVSRAVWRDNTAPDSYRAYAKELGTNSGKLISLDDHTPTFEAPSGRLLARVKKIAALLALAEVNPTIINTQEGRHVVIQPWHAESAIAIVKHGAAYAERVGRFIGETTEMRLNQEILKLLRKHKSGMTQRELCRRCSAKAADVSSVLKLNDAAGTVEGYKDGRKIIWKAV